MSKAHGGYGLGQLNFKAIHGKRQRADVARAIAALREPVDVKEELSKALEKDFADAPAAAPQSSAARGLGGMAMAALGLAGAAAAAIFAGPAAQVPAAAVVPRPVIPEGAPGWGLSPAELEELRQNQAQQRQQLVAKAPRRRVRAQQLQAQRQAQQQAAAANYAQQQRLAVEGATAAAAAAQLAAAEAARANAEELDAAIAASLLEEAATRRSSAAAARRDHMKLEAAIAASTREQREGQAAKRTAAREHGPIDLVHDEPEPQARSFPAARRATRQASVVNLVEAPQSSVVSLIDSDPSREMLGTRTGRGDGVISLLDEEPRQEVAQGRGPINLVDDSERPHLMPSARKRRRSASAEVIEL